MLVSLFAVSNAVFGVDEVSSEEDSTTEINMQKRINIKTYQTPINFATSSLGVIGAYVVPKITNFTIKMAINFIDNDKLSDNVDWLSESKLFVYGLYSLPFLLTALYIRNNSNEAKNSNTLPEIDTKMEKALYLPKLIAKSKKALLLTGFSIGILGFAAKNLCYNG